MPVFDYEFVVPAPIADVQAFHHSTEALKTLTPAPVQLHRNDPLGEGSTSRFTVWAGPLPIHWTAVHSDVTINGFTDTMTDGPMERWVHRHRFEPVDLTSTRIREHVEYEFGSGRDRVVCWLAFNRPALLGLFTYRKLRTRWALRKGQH